MKLYCKSPLGDSMVPWFKADSIHEGSPGLIPGVLVRNKGSWSQIPDRIDVWMGL